MYKFDNEFDLEIFVGKNVLQICYSISEISISWDDEGWIQFMGPFSLNFKNYDVIYPLDTDFGLLPLIGKKVIEVKTNGERDNLILYFENTTDALIF